MYRYPLAGNFTRFRLLWSTTTYMLSLPNRTYLGCGEVRLLPYLVDFDFFVLCPEYSVSVLKIPK